MNTKRKVNKTELKKYLQFWWNFNLEHFADATKQDDRHGTGYHAGALLLILTIGEDFNLWTPKQIEDMKKKREALLGLPTLARPRKKALARPRKKTATRPRKKTAARPRKKTAARPRKKARR